MLCINLLVCEYVCLVKICSLSELFANVMHKFPCLCDTALSFIRYTTSHLATRSFKYLNFNSAAKSALKDHVDSLSQMYF